MLLKVGFQVVSLKILLINSDTNQMQVPLNFFKEKFQKYNEKKLKEALKKLEFYIDLKNKLESQLKMTTNNETRIEIIKKINHNDDFINIWKKNIEIINKQSKKFE